MGLRLPTYFGRSRLLPPLAQMPASREASWPLSRTRSVRFPSWRADCSARPARSHCCPTPLPCLRRKARAKRESELLQILLGQPCARRNRAKFAGKANSQWRLSPLWLHRALAAPSGVLTRTCRHRSRRSPVVRPSAFLRMSVDDGHLREIGGGVIG